MYMLSGKAREEAEEAVEDMAGARHMLGVMGVVWLSHCGSAGVALVGDHAEPQRPAQP